MAVVGKNFAILEAGYLRSSGFVTWLVWAALHVLALPQLQNRFCVQTQWLCDRLPQSAIDPLDSSYGDRLPQSDLHESKGRRLRVAVPVNMVTLRSGQCWAHAGHEQLDDYVNNMRPRLMTGMNHLTDNKGGDGYALVVSHD